MTASDTSLLRPDHVYIIAEAGVNHNGDIQMAKQLIDVAASSGVDAVKFQVFDPEEICGQETPLAEYQKRSGETSQIDMLKSLALKHEDFAELAAYTKKQGIDFIATPFDSASAKFLVSLDVPFIKVPSGEATNLPFLKDIAALGLPVILSTGTTTLQEVEEAVAIFTEAKVDLSILHCTSAYPTPVDQVNLKAMDTLHRTFDVPVGLSDHTEGIEIAIAAAALGAVIIEKHFTLNKASPGPDHKASLEPDELENLVRSVRNVGQALGTGVKERQPLEEEVAKVVRRSVVALSDLKKGDVLVTESITLKRPGTGIPPKELNAVLGKTLKQDVSSGTLLSWDMLS